jgi:hypothetical protein
MDIDWDKVEWRKSSASNPSGNCAWIGKLPDGGTALRDEHGSTLVFTHNEWSAFLEGVRAGEFDTV